MQRDRMLVPLLIGAIVIALGLAGYFYWQFSKVKQNPQVIAQRETKALVEKVSELIRLPEGEDPTVATITDIEKLKDQPFFANAKNGDKVLLYTQAKKAILYDPVNDKIVEVAPINIGNTAATPRVNTQNPGTTTTPGATSTQ